MTWESQSSADVASGNLSYQLSSIQENCTDSFSCGSTVSADSYVKAHELIEDSDVHSYDPYLDGDIRRNRKQIQQSERSLTPATLPSSSPDDYSHSTDGNREVPILKIEIPKQRLTRHISTIEDRSRISPEILKAQDERTYWNIVVSTRIQHYSAVHPATAQALMQLGHAHARCNEPTQALNIYKSATRIFRKLYGGNNLRLASALNKVGLVACRFSENKESLTIAMQALLQGFTIRHAMLGPHHVDTVDSLNNIAGVHLHLQEYKSARRAYHEVWIVRQGLLGKYHPSVGIAAHALGAVHAKLAESMQAAKCFRIAHNIFRRNRIGPENPAMIRLQSDIHQLDRTLSLQTMLEL